MTIVGDGHKECLYYKSSVALALARVVNYAPGVVLQIVASLTDDFRSVNYNCNLFIVQATSGNNMNSALHFLFNVSTLQNFLLGQ